MLTPEEHEQLGSWIRAAYGDRSAAIIGSATRTTGLLLRIQLQSMTMWLRAGGVIERSLADTEREGLVANELGAAGVPLTAAIPRANGCLAGLLPFRETNLPAIGYLELGGVEVQEPSSAQAQTLGISLRRLHGSKVSASAQDLPAVEPSRNIDTRLSEARKWLTAGQARDLTSIVEQALERVQTASLPLTVCHGDLRYANVRFDGARPTLFDLEALGLGPAEYDLACLWRRRVIESGMVDVPKDWLWFCRGYERQDPLNVGSWSLIPPLACLRAFWTMTLPIEPRAAWGRVYRESPEYWHAHMAQMAWFGNAMLSGHPSCTERT
ncbi:MAG TPA: phosphotransferase [Polyangiaceae bacterium]|nr:phosphotransferase [Polyangiaceae bacterium]